MVAQDDSGGNYLIYNLEVAKFVSVPNFLCLIWNAKHTTAKAAALEHLNIFDWGLPS